MRSLRVDGADPVTKAMPPTLAAAPRRAFGSCAGVAVMPEHPPGRIDCSYMNRTMPVTAVMPSTEVPDIVARVRAFAVTKHGGQLRKYSDEPYVVHLDAVVGILRSFGITAPAVLAAAYLHDTVEDTEATIQDIHDSFGEQIAELVYWLTDAEQGRRRMRKTMSAWRLGRAPWDAKMIKLADLIDNTDEGPAFRTRLPPRKLQDHG
jgi:(p)ppGpp synthase/HD superfamily hydrolase